MTMHNDTPAYGQNHSFRSCGLRPQLYGDVEEAISDSKGLPWRQDGVKGMIMVELRVLISLNYYRV